MEKNEHTEAGNFPVKLEDLNVSFRGRSYPTWKYLAVPEGMRLATRRDIYLGRPILFQVMLGADSGIYYTTVVTPCNRDAVYARIEDGRWPVYVRDSNFLKTKFAADEQK